MSPQERTMVVNLNAMRAGRDWRPYVPSGLAKVTRAEVNLLGRVEWIAPLPEEAQSLSAAVAARFKDLFDQPVRMRLDTIMPMRTKDLKRVVPEQTVLCLLAPAPHRSRLLLEIDLGLAHAAVDLLLGGAGEQVARPLTDIEEGVISFAVLELLKVLGPSLEPALPRLALEGFARNVDEALTALADESHLTAVQWKAALGQKVGWIRAFLPASLLSAAQPPIDSAERRERYHRSVTEGAQRFANVRSTLWAQIGHAEILEGDLRSLRNGDVVLLDELTARPERGEGGKARLRVGRGRCGWAEAEISLAAGKFRATITALHRGDPLPPPVDESESMDGGADPEYDESTHPEGRGSKEKANVDEANAQGGDLLNDVPLQIAVEISRLPVSAEQIVSLRVGQVIELNRSPGDPVDLSVNGKVIARGELVEVEGQLGVRVLNLAG